MIKAIIEEVLMHDLAQAACTLIQWEAFFSLHFTQSLGQVIIEKDSYPLQWKGCFSPNSACFESQWQHSFCVHASIEHLLLCMEALILISFSDMAV